MPAGRVERAGLPGPVAGRPEQADRPPVRADRRSVTVLPLQEQGHVEMNAGLAGPVAELPVQLPRRLEKGGVGRTDLRSAGGTR